MSNIHSFQLSRLDNFTEFLLLENAFLPHELNILNNYWKEELAKKAELEGHEDRTEDDKIRKSSVISITPEGKNKWIYDRLTDVSNQCNHHSYSFDLAGFYEPLQLAEYKEEDFFDWHLDFGIGDSSTRKLSISIQLSDSDEYTGGDLQFRRNNNVITAPREKGTAIIFPSFIMHRVTPIKSGSRRSLVGWVSGNHYR